MAVVGAFNPPAIAHLKMMRSTLGQLRAEKGFVPTADKSLRRKMRCVGFPEEVLSEETRLAMLCAMAEDDSRLNLIDLVHLSATLGIGPEYIGVVLRY